MATWSVLPKTVTANTTTGFFNEPFFDTGFFAEATPSDGWTKVPKESADD